MSLGFWVFPRSKERSNNLIIFGLPGQKNEVDEWNLIGNILEGNLGLEYMPIKSLQRLESKKGMRPLLVRMEKAKDKWTILNKAKILRNSENLKVKYGEDTTRVNPKKVYIHPDLTKREREANKKLTDELQKLRDEGKTDLQIHRGRIVRREDVLGEKIKEARTKENRNYPPSKIPTLTPNNNGNNGACATSNEYQEEDDEMDAENTHINKRKRSEDEERAKQDANQKN